MTVFAEHPLFHSLEELHMLKSWIGESTDVCDAKKCLLFYQIFSLASLLPLAAYFEMKLTGSDREGKVRLMLVLFELNNVPQDSC